VLITTNSIDTNTIKLVFNILLIIFNPWLDAN